MTSSRPILHIALAATGNYIPHTAATILSTVINTPEHLVHAHIISNDVSHKQQRILEELAQTHDCLITVHTISPSFYDNLHLTSGDRLTIETYFRCFLGRLLSEDIQRVLYLDCDMIVRKSVAPLWNTPLDGKAIAVVEEFYAESKIFKRLCYPASDGYFNAGMLLINLDYWRKNNVEQRLLDYFAQYPERILMDDQDLLNSVLREEKLTLDYTWNVQELVYRPNFIARLLRLDHPDMSFVEHIPDPAIMHYTGLYKPWTAKCDHPFANDYWKYLRLTPFYPHTWHTRLQRILRKKIFLPLGLGKRRFFTTEELPQHYEALRKLCH